MLMGNYGFLIHSTDIELMVTAFREPNMTRKKDAYVSKLLEWLPAFKCSKITGLESVTGKSVGGELIYIPFTPEQILHLPQDIVLQRIVEGGQIAKDLGAKVIGLGAYTANVGRHGVLIAEALAIPVTTGSAYTVGAAIEATLQAAALAGMGLGKTPVAVIGATGAIGNAIAQILAPQAAVLYLVARSRDRLESLAKRLRELNPQTHIQIVTEIKDAVQSARVIFVSTNTPETLINVSDLRPGTLVCDISQPRNVAFEEATPREDILVIDGGVVRPPGRDIRLNFYFGLPEGLAYACMAETMILALEERYESYSIGGNITAIKVREILALAHKHGFKIAELKSFGNLVSPQRIRRFAESVHNGSLTQ